MEILIFKDTKDENLFIGLKVCYKNLDGVYSKLGVITETYEKEGITHYILNTSFGSYHANELKLIK